GDQVEATLLAVGPVGAEARELGIDEPRVHLPELVVAEPRAVHDGGAVVLHEHIRAGDQLEEDLPAARGFVVEGDALLVPVDVAEVGVALVAVSHGAGVVTSAWALELDHLRAHVSEDHGAVGSRHVLRHVHDLHAGQGTTLTLLSHAASGTGSVRALDLRSVSHFARSARRSQCKLSGTCATTPSSHSPPPGCPARTSTPPWCPRPGPGCFAPSATSARSPSPARSCGSYASRGGPCRS